MKRTIPRPLLSLLLLFSPAGLRAVTPHVVVTASARDFLSGDSKGTAVTADGRLTLGAPLAPRAWPEDANDAVIFGAAAGPEGRVWVATGGGLGRLFVSGPRGIDLAFRAPEPNVTAVAVAPDGVVWCATSPNGRIYRVDTRQDPARAGTPVGEPQEAAIWALAFAPDGTLYAGTGNRGRIYRLRPGGKSELFREIGDTHVRALAVGPDGTVYAGTSDRGLLVAIPASGGSVRTLYDSSRPEVVGIAVDASGTIYAAASAAEPALRPPVTVAPPRPPPTPTPAPATTPSAEPKAPEGSVSVSTSVVRLTPSAAGPGGGNSEIVAVAKDGFVEPAWTFPDETIFSLRAGSASRSLLVTTGPKGRIYSWSDRHVRLEAQTGEKVVVAAPPVGSGFAAVTMGAPGVLRPSSGPPSGTYTAAVKDTLRQALFGHIRCEGEVPAGSHVAFEVRSGNSDKPDETWSPWTPTAPDGGARLPASRYFQWRAELGASPQGAAPVLERVEFSYAERNARPVLENVTVLEPGAVFPRAGGGSAVLTVTNPDENGIYAGLEPPGEPAGPEPPLRRLFRKGYRTVTWKGSDPNGDVLRYDLEARREGSPVWFPIRRDLDEPWYSFDTTALPDGRYRFRVTASDRLSNPEGEALTATEEGPIAVIDNTPPVLAVETRRIVGGDLEVHLLAEDALSPLVKAEGAVNADRWRLVPAEKGIADSPKERFVFRVPRPPGPAILTVRVVDAAGNWAAISVEYPRDFR